MNDLYIIIAISKSGKSTWCKSILPKLHNTILVSLDNIKHSTKPSHLIAFDLINKGLAKGNVLFDANNCKWVHRINLLLNLKHECNLYAVVFDVSLKESLRNLKNYKGKVYVTPNIIKRQYKEYIKDIDKLSDFIIISKSGFEKKFIK